MNHAPTSAASQEAAAWKPAEVPITTPWADEIDPAAPLPEYPRPQLRREAWQNLNGLWDYAIAPADASRPTAWDGKILVPFCVESALSGVGRRVGPDNRLWYHRRFTLPKREAKARVLLHFGAVDWEAQVIVNGQSVGQHAGGYDPFSFDITDALRDGENELVVSVRDPSDAATQPRGKQVNKPEGIWYTPVTGIWQTVWLETVPQQHVQRLRIIPDVDAGAVHVTVEAAGQGTVSLVAFDGGTEVATADGTAGEAITLRIPQPKLWSPDSPHLYDLQITLGQGQITDTVESYFGLRKISLGKDAKGINRLMLNNQPLFQYGVLDQGWWPDGLYTPPTDGALEFDVQFLKDTGMNLARKHVKVEPARWYYHCDRLGILVWQDMPNGDAHIKPDEPDIERTPESQAIYERELKAMIDALHNHPCIVVWVPFNEGWGQFRTNEILAWTKQYDPTRLTDGPSGWTDRGQGDMNDMHEYPGPNMPEPEANRAVVLGEFGGLGLAVPGHLWLQEGNWGYRNLETAAVLDEGYAQLIKELHPLIDRGLAAAIYTQLSDVEVEINGLLTYDRRVTKISPERLRDLHAELFRRA